MKTAWLPIIGEILILILAIMVFMVMYDCLVKGKSIKESLSDRIILILFTSGAGEVIVFLGIALVFFLVYSIFFE